MTRCRVLRHRPDLNELREALDETVSLYLPEPGHPVHVQLEVTEEQARIHAACRPGARLQPPAGAGPPVTSGGGIGSGWWCQPRIAS
jgi:DNA-binding IclR family transcriptional regulator